MRKLLAAGVLCLLASAVTAQAQDTKLWFADAPSLISCDDRPCLWIRVDRKDAANAPMGLPSDVSAYRVEDLRGPTPKELRVFYVTDMTNADAAQRRPVFSMLLFDMSGSMAFPVAGGGRESRFDAAIQVLRDFILTSFKEGTDNWAIVGFESHQVVARIGGAPFAKTRQEALEQLRQLGTPAPRNNTALFSAIFEALPILKEKKKAGNDASLIVFTDGRNDVDQGRGDDPNLLTGDTGRWLVMQAASATGIEIVPIGFGKRGAADFDEDTLKSLAYPTPANYHYAADSASLAKVLKGDQALRAMRVRISVQLSEKEKNELTQKIPLRVYLRGGDRAHSVKETEISFTPNVPIPWWEGAISGKEKDAFDELPVVAGPDRLLVKVMIFSGFLAFFALAWFGLPRLAWPESYIPRPTLPAMPVAAGLESVPKQRPGDAWRSRQQSEQPPQREAPPPRQAPRAPTRPETPSPRQGSASGEWRQPRAPDDDATRYGVGGAPPQGHRPDDARQRPQGDATRRPPSDEPPPRGGGTGPGPDDWRQRGGPGSGGGGGGPAPRRPAGPQPAPGRTGAEPPRSSDDATVYIPRGKKYEQDT